MFTRSCRSPSLSCCSGQTGTSGGLWPYRPRPFSPEWTHHCARNLDSPGIKKTHTFKHVIDHITWTELAACVTKCPIQMSQRVKMIWFSVTRCDSVSCKLISGRRKMFFSNLVSDFYLRLPRTISKVMTEITEKRKRDVMCISAENKHMPKDDTLDS